MSPALWLALFVGINLAVVVALFLGSRAHFARFRAFADALSEGEFRPGPGLGGSGIIGSSVKGRFEGRSVQLDALAPPRGAGSWGSILLRFSVEGPRSQAPFSMTPAEFSDQVGRRLGLVTDVKVGDPRIDQRFIVRGERAPLVDLFGRGLIQPVLEQIFGDEEEFAWLEVDEGWTSGVRKLSGEQLVRVELLGTLALLGQFVEQCESAGP